MRSTAIRRTSAWVSAFVMASFSYTSVVSAQTISNTGTDSTNSITTNVREDCTVRNNNTVSATNTNSQNATSGDATEAGNTTAGASWSGWSNWNPQTAQHDGLSYASWNSGLTNWIGQHASSNGWNSAENNLSWIPSASNWNNWDPMSWQANGQSFGNWYNAVQSYLDSNSSAWLLSWPPDATGNAIGGAQTGNATNHNSTNFTININNAARAASGTNACGQSNFTPPSGGMGGGNWTPSTSAPAVATSYNPTNYGGTGAGSYSSTPHASSNYIAPAATSQQSSAPPTAATSYNPPVIPQQPSTPAAPITGASISNTGTGSTNTITANYTSTTTVTNNNNVTASNWSSQTSSTGDATVYGNTTAGGGGSGAAANGNGTGFDTGISN